MEVRDVRAMVTGAASGIGYTFALELARAGASVFAGDVNEEGLARLAAECAPLPGEVHVGVVDVSSEPGVRSFVESAYGRLGSVNVLVNNAGVLLDGMLVKPEEGWVKKLPLPQWRRVLDTNLTGVFLMGREVAALMLERGTRNALIVNLSSLFRWGNEGQTSYSASKAGIDAITRSWALELAEYGVRVCAIAPGLVETPILENISDETKEKLRNRVPMRRFGTTGEIWLALRFIIECEYFNGSILEVDGGSGI